MECGFGGSYDIVLLVAFLATCSLHELTPGAMPGGFLLL